MYHGLDFVGIVSCVDCVHQDIGLPYMLDRRHPLDTFFFVFEADFRFYEEDCLDPEEWLSAAAHENFGATEFFAERGDDEKGLDDSQGAPSPTAGRDCGHQNN